MNVLIMQIRKIAKKTLRMASTKIGSSRPVDSLTYFYITKRVSHWEKREKMPLQKHIQSYSTFLPNSRLTKLLVKTVLILKWKGLFD